jgi:Ca2+-binding RTX toxin-like protein
MQENFLENKVVYLKIVKQTRLFGLTGNNLLKGGTGDDQLNQNNSSGDNLLYGGDGRDYLYANNSSGITTLNGGAGDDSVTFQSIQSFSITATNYDDSLEGGQGNDFFNTKDGDDTVKGGSGDNRIEGGS